MSGNFHSDYMESLRELYKIGVGPSSSHTMGPERAARQIKERFPSADKFVVYLYGSLAKTGKGHRTDYIINETLRPIDTEIVFDFEHTDLPHPNTMKFVVYENGDIVDEITVASVGGGEIRFMGEKASCRKKVYQLHTFSQIAEYCRENDKRIWQYVEEVEGPEIWDYLDDIWSCMKKAIRDGLQADGELFGGLNVQRKAKQLYNHRHMDELEQTRENRIVCSYAFAVSEQNASCSGNIVTAPTCGACGVLPAVMKYTQDKRNFSDNDILHALATGGIIGNLIKTNASISGAEAGCQAEIGTACSMAAAALAELYGMELDQIEYAAEIAIEHHLGLTCDPVNGLVQIPCIERNAVAAMRAINAVNLANFLYGSRKISFDLVVQTMYETGKDLSSRYRETSEGGLAKLYK